MKDKHLSVQGNNNTDKLIADLREIVKEARSHVALNVNYEHTLMCWHIGERINRDVLGYERAAYGKQIVSAVSTQLQKEFGRIGFEIRNVRKLHKSLDAAKFRLENSTDEGMV